MLVIDTNGDDSGDYAIEELGADSYAVHQDSNGDGVYQTSSYFTRAELDDALPGITDLLDSVF